MDEQLIMHKEVRFDAGPRDLQSAFKHGHTHDWSVIRPGGVPSHEDSVVTLYTCSQCRAEKTVEIW